MSLILPAFSSPDLKAFPLCSKSSKSSEGGQSWPLRAQWRDSVIYSAPLPLHSINPTDSPDSRISVGALVVLSVSLYLSRKDPYLPLHPLCVRLLPRPMGLPPMAFAVSFRIRFADAKTAVKHHRPTHIRPLEPHHKCTLISRPTTVHHGYIYIESVRRYSCYFTALLPMCIRLT